MYEHSQDDVLPRIARLRAISTGGNDYNVIYDWDGTITTHSSTVVNGDHYGREMTTTDFIYILNGDTTWETTITTITCRT